jgi:hypothetical protein
MCEDLDRAAGITRRLPFLLAVVVVSCTDAPGPPPGEVTGSFAFRTFHNDGRMEAHAPPTPQPEATVLETFDPDGQLLRRESLWIRPSSAPSPPTR